MKNHAAGVLMVALCACGTPGSTTEEMDAAVGSPVRVTVQVTGEGTLVSEPLGLYCGVQCEATFSSGTALTLTAVPAEGWRVGSFTVGGAACAEPCVLSGLTNDVEVSVAFFSGPVVWARGVQVDGDNQIDAVAVDSSGNVYVAVVGEGLGGFGVDAPARGSVVAKMTATGMVEWVKALAGATATINSLSVDGEDNVVLTGTYTKENPFNAFAPVIETGFVARYSSAGALLHALADPQPDGVFLPTATACVGTDVWVTGSVAEDVTLDGTVLLGGFSGNLFLLRMTAAGELPYVWADTYGGGSAGLKLFASATEVAVLGRTVVFGDTVTCSDDPIVPVTLEVFGRFACAYSGAGRASFAANVPTGTRDIAADLSFVGTVDQPYSAADYSLTAHPDGSGFIGRNLGQGANNVTQFVTAFESHVAAVPQLRPVGSVEGDLVLDAAILRGHGGQDVIVLDEGRSNGWILGGPHDELVVSAAGNGRWLAIIGTHAGDFEYGGRMLEGPGTSYVMLLDLSSPP
jgi:hypothetical protein